MTARNYIAMTALCTLLLACVAFGPNVPLANPPPATNLFAVAAFHSDCAQIPTIAIAISAFIAQPANNLTLSNVALNYHNDGEIDTGSSINSIDNSFVQNPLNGVLPAPRAAARNGSIHRNTDTSLNQTIRVYIDAWALAKSG